MFELMAQVRMTTETLTTTSDAPPATGVADAPAACLISKVKEQIRAIDFGAYQPQSVMIGPYHRHQDPSGGMKKELLQLFSPDSTRGLGAPELRPYITAMEGLEDRARRCYDSPFSPTTSEEFARMLLLDGLFILSWFMLGNSDREKMTSLRTLGNIAIVRDIVYLLENQVPFFVLEKLYEVINRRSAADSAVMENVARFIRELVRCHGYANTTVTVDPRPCHLLHLLYMHFRPVALGPTTPMDGSAGAPNNVTSNSNQVQLTISPASNSVNANANARAIMIQRASSIPCHLLHQVYVYFRPTNPNTASSNTRPSPNEGGMPATAPVARWRSATYYHDNGVRLRTRGLDGDRVRSILDVELRDGTLHVPCLTVDNETWRILRNLMALEQHNRHLGSHVTAYCLFVSQLASREMDVELLATKKILVHFLGSDEEVAAGFASLCKGIVLNTNDPNLNYLSPTWEALEKLCRSRRRKSMAWLRHKQCNNFAMVVALAAAVVIFLFTVEQGVFAALDYFKGSS